MGGKLRHSCPCPQAPSTPGKEQTGPGVAANKNNAVVLMEPLLLREVAPSTHLCSRQPGPGRNRAPGFTADTDPLPTVTQGMTSVPS